MLSILYVIRSAGHIRSHKSTIEVCVRRGNRVEVCYDPRFSNGGQIEKAQKLCESLHVSLAPARTPRAFGAWVLLYTRDLLSYRRYLVNRDIAHLELFRRDWKVHLPFPVRVFLALPGAASLVMTRWFANMLTAVEGAFPADTWIVRDIVGRKPDVVIVSPVNMRQSSAELEYLKAARALHIKTVLPVFSWDNLTVRGLFHILPDRVLCWNQPQADEARRHQGVPLDHIKIVGAPVFDPWFDHGLYTMPRDEFCRTFGLRAEDSIVTYLGSARNIAQDETSVLRALRAAFDASSDERIRKIQIILRVHPANFKAYMGFSLSKTVEIPPRGSLPDTEEALKLFHDTLAHSIAVIQINTSGAIDAIIDGKPFISLLYPEFATQQVETIHFKQLMESGASDIPKTPQECVQNLIHLLDGDDARAHARRSFVESFIRPRGIEKTVGECVYEEVESLV